MAARDSQRGGAQAEEVPPGLLPFWDKTVQHFVQLDELPIAPPAQERHRIYALLLMALIADRWNGNKYGETGDYGQWRAGQLLTTSPNVYSGGSYLGHNIAALAVDADGRVIDFDFNHNEVFDSSVEHAESRLIRRVFALNQVYDPWQLDRERPRRARDVPARQRHQLFATAVTDRAELVTARTAERVASGYSTLLSDVTVYTSLEPCAQCTGIMCLASVKEVVYLQPDDGQFLIGNIMRRATKAQPLGFTAPRPVSGTEIDLGYYNELATGYQEFMRRVLDEPFYRKGDHTIRTPSLTSFLCTDAAYRIYGQARAELGRWKAPKYPEHRPEQPESSFTNQQALALAKDFLQYLRAIQNRGTAHRV
ncbi:hypothetical protein [Streptomyces syringium]|uniref:hypothetical protein n=1 Tax=Streptomyces syringium TaxID=76729 RepID=UPI0033DA7AF5